MAVAAEAKEYDTAVAFFEDNGLSTEGLSRSDLKAVYRDITTQSFTYGKTEELAELWNRNLWQNAQLDDGVSYRIYYQYKLDKALGFDVLDNSVLDCYQAGTLLWTVEFPGLLVEDSVHTSAGTAVWCRNET